MLEEEFAALAEQFDVPAFRVQQFCQLEARAVVRPLEEAPIVEATYNDRRLM